VSRLTLAVLIAGAAVAAAVAWAQAPPAAVTRPPTPSTLVPAGHHAYCECVAAESPPVKSETYTRPATFAAQTA